MQRPEIKFGTDGWRAIIADDFTFANVRACAEAVARNLVASGRSSSGLVVGFDTRFGSARFAKAVADVVNGYGIATYTFDVPAPTPACSFAVVDHEAGNWQEFTKACQKCKCSNDVQMLIDESGETKIWNRVRNPEDKNENKIRKESK